MLLNLFPAMSLKSNMDRFIENDASLTKENKQALKSNMDRFIGSDTLRNHLSCRHLKSNMDRFIEYR